jgi:hypothetical protein
MSALTSPLSRVRTPLPNLQAVIWLGALPLKAKVGGVILLGLFIVVAIIGPWLAPFDPVGHDRRAGAADGADRDPSAGDHRDRAGRPVPAAGRDHGSTLSPRTCSPA